MGNYNRHSSTRSMMAKLKSLRKANKLDSIGLPGTVSPAGTSTNPHVHPSSHAATILNSSIDTEKPCSLTPYMVPKTANETGESFKTARMCRLDSHQPRNISKQSLSVFALPYFTFHLCGKISGGWHTFNDVCVHHSHRGCPILAFFARVGGDGACYIFVCHTSRLEPHLRRRDRPTCAGIPDSRPSPRTRRTDWIRAKARLNPVVLV